MTNEEIDAVIAERERRAQNPKRFVYFLEYFDGRRMREKKVTFEASDFSREEANEEVKRSFPGWKVSMYWPEY